MSAHFVTIVDGGSPLMQAARDCSKDLIAACHVASGKLRQPGDRDLDVTIAAVSHALQNVMAQARREGLGDGDLYKAIAAALGNFAVSQNLGPDVVVLQNLAKSGLIAANLARGMAPTGFPTRGTA